MVRHESTISWNIVLVDDDSNVLNIYEHLLMKMGHRVMAFVSPLEALAYIDSNRDAIDMLVTDFKMPELDGLQLIQRVRKIHALLPVLILSGFTEGSALANVTASCEACVMAKPARYNQIKAHIESLQNSAD
jgi:DNA-binding NtrC family response regulator